MAESPYEIQTNGPFDLVLHVFCAPGGESDLADPERLFPTFLASSPGPHFYPSPLGHPWLVGGYPYPHAHTINLDVLSTSFNSLPAGSAPEIIWR